MAGGPIKWDSGLACLLTKAKGNWLVGSQLKIKLLDIIVHKLLHLLDHPYWQCKCKVETHRQFDSSASSDIVFATHCTTCGDIDRLRATVYYANTREVSFFIKKITSKLIPMCTSSVFVEHIILYKSSILATF